MHEHSLQTKCATGRGFGEEEPEGREVKTKRLRAGFDRELQRSSCVLFPSVNPNEQSLRDDLLLLLLVAVVEVLVCRCAFITLIDTDC